MERGGRGMGPRQRWRKFKDRLRFKGVACCGSPWARSRAAHIRSRSPFDASTTSFQEDAASAATVERGGPRYRREAAAAARYRRESDQDFGCILDQAPAGDVVEAIDEEEEEMNLAMALAAERQLRAAERDTMMMQFSERSSLIRLMKEGEEVMMREKEEEEEEEEGREWWGCCVCMGRRKGAAFIPCGHTFCRVCARELWMTRGSCPLCNQLILETLDIY